MTQLKILTRCIKPYEIAEACTTLTYTGIWLFDSLNLMVVLYSSYQKMINFIFLCRTALELVAAGVLMIFYARFGEIDGISTAMFDCYVHEVPFNCVIPNHRFFMVSTICHILLLDWCVIENEWFSDSIIGCIKNILGYIQYGCFSTLLLLPFDNLQLALVGASKSATFGKNFVWVCK